MLGVQYIDGGGDMVGCHVIGDYSNIILHKNAYVNDGCLLLAYEKHDSPIKLLPDFTTTYRILDESASHSRKFINRLMFDTGALRCRKFFADKYGYMDISRFLEKKIKTNLSMLEFYNGNYKSFISSKPWIYGIGLKEILSILLEKYYDKNIK